jgi:hypothetical protein
VIPEELEECGWGLIDWRAVPDHMAAGLLRAAERIARDGHAVAFTGREYETGPELTVDGHLTVTRYLSGQPGLEAMSGAAADPDWAATPGLGVSGARERLAAVVADAGRDGRRVAVVCDRPDLSQEDASRVIAGWRQVPGPAGSGGVDIYGYGWTAHA